MLLMIFNTPPVQTTQIQYLKNNLTESAINCAYKFWFIRSLHIFFFFFFEALIIYSSNISSVVKFR